jgi:hypothetical protein
MEGNQKEIVPQLEEGELLSEIKGCQDMQSTIVSFLSGLKIVKRVDADNKGQKNEPKDSYKYSKKSHYEDKYHCSRNKTQKRTYVSKRKYTKPSKTNPRYVKQHYSHCSIFITPNQS